jgi:hypothetical protein
MIGTRMKARTEKQQSYKKDLSNIYFSKADWTEVKIDSSEGKKSIVPPKRHGHTFAVVNGRVFLIGGCIKANGRNPLNLYELSLERGSKGSSEVAQWRKHILSGGENIFSIESHTSEVFQGSIYIMCGCVNEDISNRIYRIDVEKMSIHEVNISGTPLKNRESHVSFMFMEKFVIIHGGINGIDEEERTIKMGKKDSICIVDLESKRRIDPNDIEEEGPAPSERECHVRIVHKNGVYIFGGLSISSDGVAKEEGITGTKKEEQKEKVPLEDKSQRGARMKNRRKFLENELDQKGHISLRNFRLEDLNHSDRHMATEPPEVIFHQHSGYMMMNELSTNYTDKREKGDTVDYSEDQQIKDMTYFNQAHIDRVNIASNGELKPVEESEEDEEDVTDFLNDLYLLKCSRVDGKFYIKWERINYSGHIPKSSSLIGLNVDNDFLLFFGGQGYYPGKEYLKEDSGDMLNTVHCLHLESNSAFWLTVTGVTMDPVHNPATFSYKGKHFVHGGQNSGQNINSRLCYLDIEQRVKKDLFGNFSGSMQEMCLQCKNEYELCINNMECQLRLLKKSIAKRVDSDKKVAVVYSERPKFMIPQEVKEDIMQIIEMEKGQDSFRYLKDTKSILNVLSFIVHTFLKTLFLTSINFEYLGQRTIGMAFEGSFNIFEQLDKLEHSIMDSIFFYLILHSSHLQADGYLYVKLKSKVLCFDFAGSSPQGKLRFQEIDHLALPEKIADTKFKQNLIVFDNCPNLFAREDVGSLRDIKIITLDDRKCNIRSSFRSFFAYFFREKVDNFKVSVCGQTVQPFTLADIVKNVNISTNFKMLKFHPNLKAINVVVKSDGNSKNPALADLLGKHTYLHYNKDYLIFVDQVDSPPNSEPDQGSLALMVEYTSTNSII